MSTFHNISELGLEFAFRSHMNPGYAEDALLHVSVRSLLLQHVLCHIVSVSVATRLLRKLQMQVFDPCCIRIIVLFS